MLNCFKDYKRHIHILNHILDLPWPTLMKLNLELQYMLSALHSQCHACWWTDDFKSQCINRHGKLEYSVSSIKGVNVMKFIHLQTEDWKLSWCWLYCVCQHCRLSFWQPIMSTTMTKSASWWMLLFSADVFHFAVDFMLIVVTNYYIIFMHIVFFANAVLCKFCFQLCFSLK